jgi:hypothetical protein
MWMTSRMGSAKSSGSPWRSAISAAGPPVETPMATARRPTALAGRWRAGTGALAGRGGALRGAAPTVCKTCGVWAPAPSFARGWVMTLIRVSTLSVETSRSLHASAGSSSRGLSSTSSAPAASAW